MSDLYSAVMSELYNSFRQMLYFGCPYCGSENVYDFVFIHCNNCHRDWSWQALPAFLPGQVIVRAMIGAPGFHYGWHLGNQNVFHSTPALGAHFTSLAEFRQGRAVWAYCEPAGSEAELRQMLTRARMKTGARWVAGDNCEDVAFYVRDGIANSPTRNLLTGGLFVCGLLLVAAHAE